jgi:hypothetical protein
MRSELVLIDVEGQRLLLGVAPHSIQTLYIVPETPAEDVASEPARGETSSAFARRLAGALDSREQGELPERETRPKTGKVTSAAKAPRGRPMQDEDDEDEVEEQARGLRALGARR